MNEPLAAHTPATTPVYRLAPRNPPKERPDLLLALFFSGGGMRAAAFSYGVLEELNTVRVAGAGSAATLLGQVDAISAVSGGTLTAAYYCAYGDRIFKDFEDQVLTHNLERDLMLRALRPDNLYRLGSAYYARSDLAADYYNGKIFHGLTFGDLARLRGRPFLIINATDISTGARFGFTQTSFDLIGSDLSPYSVARAVAASTAVPFLLTPITLRNYAAGTAREEQIAETIEQPLADRFTRLIDDLNSYHERPDRRYIHLVDGGVADNLGLRAFQEFTMLNGGLAGSLQHLGMRRVARIAVILADASVHRDGMWDGREATPGAFSVMKAISQSMVSRDSFETTDLLKRSMERWQQRMRSEQMHTSEGSTPSLDFYFINLNFASIADRTERTSFSAIGTNFALTRLEVERVRLAARALLQANPEYQRLLRDMAGESQELHGTRWNAVPGVDWISG